MIELRDGTTVEDPRLDRLVHFDDRSRGFSIGTITRGLLPHTKTWSLATFLNQGREGSCAGNAWAHELAAEPAVLAVDEPYAVGIYWDAQRTDQWPGGAYPGATPHYDGTSVLAAAKVVQSRGFMPEYRWAFNTYDLILAVGNTGPAVIGVRWYEAMSTPGADGFIHPTGRVVGGHCILVVGVDLTKQAFLLHNSWGPSWGQHGRAWLGFPDMDKLLKQQGEACIPVRRTIPSPPPAA